MDFLNFLIPKEKIVGLEIGSQKLRLIYLDKDGYGHIRTVGRAEAKLESNTVVLGEIKDKKKLSEALVQLKENFKPAEALSSFAVVTIPPNKVYSEILEFPKELDNDQMVEAISLNAAANLPLSLSECYLDWQTIGSRNRKNRVLVSLIPKKIADPYIEVLKENKFELIALEPFSLSLARSANLSDEPTALFYLTDEGLTSAIYDKKTPYFCEFELWEEAGSGRGITETGAANDILRDKLEKLDEYFANQFGLNLKKVSLVNGGFGMKVDAKKIAGQDYGTSEAKTKAASLKDGEWLQAKGAALRSFVPRSEDTIISLLPVGTESLYETEKALSFLKSIRFLMSALAFFYVVVFIASFVFVSSLAASLNSQLELRGKLPLPVEYLRMDSEIKEFNGYVGDLARIYPRVGRNHAAVLDSIGKISAVGISLTNVNFGDSLGTVSVYGVAASRENLNAFKYQVENSNLFGNVNFVIQNIGQKSSVPFSLNLSVR